MLGIYFMTKFLVGFAAAFALMAAVGNPIPKSEDPTISNSDAVFSPSLTTKWVKSTKSDIDHAELLMSMADLKNFTWADGSSSSGDGDRKLLASALSDLKDKKKWVDRVQYGAYSLTTIYNAEQIIQEAIEGLRDLSQTATVMDAKGGISPEMFSDCLKVSDRLRGALLLLHWHEQHLMKWYEDKTGIPTWKE